MMENYLVVFLGGGIGSTLRFAIANIDFQKITQFPVNTLLSNSFACLLLGVFLGVFTFRVEFLPLTAKLFLITGICGGFSTYSAFAFETLELIKLEKYVLATGNIFLNLILCIFMISAGMFVAKLFN